MARLWLCMAAVCSATTRAPTAAAALPAGVAVAAASAASASAGAGSAGGGLPLDPSAPRLRSEYQMLSASHLPPFLISKHHSWASTGAFVANANTLL